MAGHFHLHNGGLIPSRQKCSSYKKATKQEYLCYCINQEQLLQLFTLGRNTANKRHNVWLGFVSKKLSQLNFSHQRFSSIFPGSGYEMSQV